MPLLQSFKKLFTGSSCGCTKKNKRTYTNKRGGYNPYANAHDSKDVPSLSDTHIVKRKSRRSSHKRSSHKRSSGSGSGKRSTGSRKHKH